MSPPREFVREVPLARLARAPLDITITAEPAELAALAARYGIIAVEALSCRFQLAAERDRVAATCLLDSVVVQPCVVSLEPVTQTVREAFALHFVPADAIDDDPDPEAIDEVAHDGQVLDLGEAAAEQLALALDPYPRLPDASLPEGATDEHAGSFAGLARLRTRQS